MPAAKGSVWMSPGTVTGIDIDLLLHRMFHCPPRLTCSVPVEDGAVNLAIATAASETTISYLPCIIA